VGDDLDLIRGEARHELGRHGRRGRSGIEVHRPEEPLAQHCGGPPADRGLRDAVTLLTL
jgi:hypothetical protein